MFDIIDIIIGNWALIGVAIVGIALGILFVLKAVKFFKLPFVSQKTKIKECMLTWVLSAEQSLGGQTGKAKLSMVYSYFVEAFPFVKNFVSLETFSKWVDEALDEAEELLAENKNLSKIVLGEPEGPKEDK